MGAGPGFTTRPGNPDSGSKILNSGFRAGFVFGSGLLKGYNKQERISHLKKNSKKIPKNSGPGSGF